MKVLKSTMDTIMELSGKVGRPSVFMVFMYYVLHGQDGKNAKDIRTYLGITERYYDIARSGLKEAGVVKESNGPKGVKLYTVSDPPDQFSFVTVYYSLISKYNSNRNKTKTNTYGDETKLNKDDFKLEDIVEDPDWIAMREILIKYFKPYQVEPPLLVTQKQYYKKLSLLWDDLGPEKFDAYCEWYRVKKYPQVKFKFGMFLYPGVIGDWKDDTDDEDTRYMSTGSAKQKEKFKKAAKSSIEELERIMSEDDNG